MSCDEVQWGKAGLIQMSRCGFVVYDGVHNMLRGYHDGYNGCVIIWFSGFHMYA